MQGAKEYPTLAQKHFNGSDRALVYVPSLGACE